MKELRIGICEDDITQLKYLKQEVENYYTQNGISVVIEIFESAEQLLFQYPSDLPFHCLLLDIGLKKMDGMNLAKRIRERDKELTIIFITGERDYVFEGYKVGAVRFLLKPYRPEDLAEALSCVAKLEEEKSSEEYIGFRYQGEYVKLKKNDILYVKVNGHYLYLKLTDREYSYKGSMKQLKEEWNEPCFVYANRSMLVNLENVERITRTECVLSNGESLPVSRGCYQNLNQAFVEMFV